MPACTVKPLVNVEFWPSVLVTVTLRVPIAALASTLMFAVICVEELKVQEFTVVPEPKLHEGLLRKFVPVKTMLKFV